MIRLGSAKRRFMMKRGTLVCAAAAVAMLVGLMSAGAMAQDNTRVFVVYGAFYSDGNETPVSHTYFITVENETQLSTLEVSTGSGADQGKYSAIFIETGEMPVAALGDKIVISARKEGETAEYIYATTNISLVNILNMRIRIDLIEDAIAVEDKTWGAVKSLFGLE